MSSLEHLKQMDTLEQFINQRHDVNSDRADDGIHEEDEEEESKDYAVAKLQSLIHDRKDNAQALTADFVN